MATGGKLQLVRLDSDSVFFTKRVPGFFPLCEWLIVSMEELPAGHWRD